MANRKRKKSLKFNTLKELTDAVAESIVFKMVLLAANLEGLRPDTSSGPGWRLHSDMVEANDAAIIEVLATYASRVKVTRPKGQGKRLFVDYTLLAHQDDIISVILAIKSEAERLAKRLAEPLACPFPRHFIISGAGMALNRNHSNWLLLRTRIGQPRSPGATKKTPDSDASNIVPLRPQ